MIQFVQLRVYRQSQKIGVGQTLRQCLPYTYYKNSTKPLSRWQTKIQSVTKIYTSSISISVFSCIQLLQKSGFMKIRHYGFLGNRNKTTKLKLCKHLTNTPVLLKEKISTLQLIQKITGRDFSKCPNCGSDKLNRCTLFPKSPHTTLQTAQYLNNQIMGKGKLCLYFYN